jgi:hypothetical protein
MVASNPPRFVMVQNTPASPRQYNLAERPLQVVTACRIRDLPVLEIAVERLRQHIPLGGVNVLAPDRDCARIAARLGGRARVIPENGFVPGMTVAKLRELKLEGFPKAAGWYFQQLLKLQFAFVDPEDDYYLIWDADTIPLRPLRFFDPAGRMILTKAEEYHAPYFQTYRALFGSEPNREFSFIAQHILVQKSVAREMMARIEERVPVPGDWAWKVMNALPPTGKNLFSEYETYGHYIKNHYPDRVVFVKRSWQRAMTNYTSRPIPTERELQELAGGYEYAAFERVYSGWHRPAYSLLTWIRGRPSHPRLPGVSD